MNTPTARPNTVTIILVSLIILALASAISVGSGLLLARNGFGGAGGTGGRQFNGTPQANRTPGSGTPSAGGDNTQGSGQAGGSNFPGAGQQGNGGNFTGGQAGNGGTGGNFQGRTNQGGFSMFTIVRALGLPFQIIGILSIAFPIIGILLVLLCAWGVWKMKMWGLNMATLMAVIFLIGAVSTLMTPIGRNINWMRIILNAVSVVATLPVLGLSFLPSVRDYFPKPQPKPRTK